ncbi:uncharacterized protein JCM10292_002936 [Rhodotorula paludigena]|uniref:uncharacterized protein n=1 Tax=Rhodotorula paludigena TaxID=86838 RepID=UPI003175D5E9
MSVFFPRRQNPAPAAPPPPPAAPLPPAPASPSEGPQLPPLTPLLPLDPPTLPPALQENGANSPASSQCSHGSFGRASASTTDRATASTRPSSVESANALPPKALAFPLAPPTDTVPPSAAVPVDAAASTTPPDTPTALLKGLSIFPPVSPLSRPTAVFPPASSAAGSTTPRSPRGLGLPDDEHTPVEEPSCGCELPLSDGEVEHDDELYDADEGDDAFDAFDEEAERLFRDAQAHMADAVGLGFSDGLGASLGGGGVGKRPSLPLPALPGVTGPFPPRGSVSGSAFVEEGLTRMDARAIAEAGEGGVLGSSSEPEASASQSKSQQPRQKAVLRKKRRDPHAPVKKPKKEPFERFKQPSEDDMRAAAQCELVDEDGEKITFGELIKSRRQRRTVIIFLRHAWCGLCAQYVEALNRATLNLVSLSTTSFLNIGARGAPNTGNAAPRIPPLHVLLVNSGSPQLISSYRTRLDTPFPLYSDRSRSLYRALGMTRKTWDMGSDSDKGSYIVKSQMQNITSSISAGIAMPKYPGSQTQLGGEFVFEYDPETDSVKCLFASRMHTTRAHAEIQDVFAAAGVELNDDDAASVYGDTGA